MLLRTPIEPLRAAIDAYSKEQFTLLHSPYIFFHYLIFGNSDMYVYRPPRILSGFTVAGKPSYIVYGNVSRWDPASHLITLRAYSGGTLFVAFDPDHDGSMAYTPALDRWGGVIAFGNNDIVSSTDNPRFETLFCPSDVLMVLFSSLSSLSSSSQAHPVHATEIRLTHRLCEVKPL